MLDIEIGRRRLLGGALDLGAVSTIGATGAFAALPEKRIAFRNIHTNDTVDARFFGANGWDEQGLAELNHGLRDWRNNEQTVMDPSLMLLLSKIRDTLDVDPRT